MSESLLQIFYRFYASYKWMKIDLSFEDEFIIDWLARGLLEKRFWFNGSELESLPRF